MKFALAGIAGFYITVCLTASASYADNQSVTCQKYQDGYSVFRMSDNKNIGESYFTDADECRQAADLANQIAQNLVCSPFVNGEGDHATGYSAFRISDGGDLGGGFFAIFNDCQSAIGTAKNGVVCLVFDVTDSGATFAPYDIESGSVSGDILYPSIESCQQAHSFR